jgi:hypothetical protein
MLPTPPLMLLLPPLMLLQPPAMLLLPPLMLLLLSLLPSELLLLLLLLLSPTPPSSPAASAADLPSTNGSRNRMPQRENTMNNCKERRGMGEKRNRKTKLRPRVLRTTHVLRLCTRPLPRCRSLRSLPCTDACHQPPYMKP